MVNVIVARHKLIKMVLRTEPCGTPHYRTDEEFQKYKHIWLIISGFPLEVFFLLYAPQSFCSSRIFGGAFKMIRQNRWLQFCVNSLIPTFKFNKNILHRKQEVQRISQKHFKQGWTLITFINVTMKLVLISMTWGIAQGCCETYNLCFCHLFTLVGESVCITQTRLWNINLFTFLYDFLTQFGSVLVEFTTATRGQRFL